MKETESLSIDQMRDALTEYEIELIQSLSSHKLFDYVRDTIISRHGDDEVRELYDYVMNTVFYVGEAELSNDEVIELYHSLYTIDKGVDDDERD